MAGESARESARRQREKAERLARSAELYERGAEGEAATAEVLSGLPEEQWTVFHDLRWPGRRYANVDHVVIGPPGVFVVDSKNWSGSVVVRDHVLRQNGRSRETTVAAAAEAAIAVARLTPLVAPQQVHPVLCFVRDEPVAGWARDVMVCSTSNLLQMLTSRPPLLDAEQRRAVTLDLDAALRTATDRSIEVRRPGTAAPGARAPRRAPVRPAAAVPPTPRSRPSRSPRHRSRHRGRRAEATVGLALVLAFLFAPGLREGLVERVTTHLAPSEQTPPPAQDPGPPEKPAGRSD